MSSCKEADSRHRSRGRVGAVGRPYRSGRLGADVVSVEALLARHHRHRMRAFLLASATTAFCQSARSLASAFHHQQYLDHDHPC